LKGTSVNSDTIQYVTYKQPTNQRMKAKITNQPMHEILCNIYNNNNNTHLMALLSGTTPVSWYQKGKTNLDFTAARDSAWQWHQLDHMQVCTSPRTDTHASTPSLNFLQAGCPSCHPTNSVKALKATYATFTMNRAE